MGCSPSKRVESSVGVYQPPPSGFAVFNIDAIKEPWLPLEQEKPKPKPALFPDTIIATIETADVAPRSWDEVSKALQSLNKPDAAPKNNSKSPPAAAPPPALRHDGHSFHTLDELNKKLSTLKQSPPENTEVKKPDSAPVGFKSLKENAFIVRDRLEREKEGKTMPTKRDPLAEFPEMFPPNGAETVVIYTTSLRGVRRTYDNCEKAKSILEEQGVVIDERDVSLHGEFLRELQSLVGEEEATVPRVFVKGRYVGGVEELSQLNESGRLGRILRLARVERGVGRQACGGCGGARFVPCFHCGGSCKVVLGGGERERCSKCNENGLVLCPACL